MPGISDRNYSRGASRKERPEEVSVFLVAGAHRRAFRNMSVQGVRWEDKSFHISTALVYASSECSIVPHNSILYAVSSHVWFPLLIQHHEQPCIKTEPLLLD